MRADASTLSGGAAVSSGNIDEWGNFVTNASFTNVTTPVATGNDPEVLAGALNYNPVIGFDGDDYLAQTGIEADVLFSDDDNTVFYVFNRSVTSANNEVLTGYRDGGTRLAYFTERSGGTIRSEMLGPPNLETSTAINGYNFITLTNDNTAATKELALNGTVDDSGGSGSFTASSSTGDYVFGGLA